MKKIFLSGFFIFLFNIFNILNIEILAAPKLPKPNPVITVNKNATITKEIDGSNPNDYYYTIGINMNDNSNLKLNIKNSKGLFIYHPAPQTWKSRFSIGKSSNLDINLDNSVSATGSAINLEKKDGTDFILDKDSSLKVKAHFNGGNPNQHGSAFRTNYDNIDIYGTLDLESTGRALTLIKDAKITFKNGSKSIIKGGYTSIYGQNYSIFEALKNSDEPKGVATVVFEDGSDTTLIGGHWALLSKNTRVKKGAKLKMYGGNGMELLTAGNNPHTVFEKGSEIDILVRNIGFHAGNLEGSSKMNFKAKTLFLNVRTARGDKKFHFEDGSIIEGDIIESENGHFVIERGAKYFVQNTLQTNLTITGDVFIGPRNAYEKTSKNDYYSKMEEFDAIGGSSVIYFGNMKKGKTSPDLKDRDNNPNQYYTVTWSKGKYNQNETLNTDGGNLHFRIGGKFENNNNNNINDKLIISDDPNCKISIQGTGINIIGHPTNIDKVKPIDVFDLIEEQNLPNDTEFDLEKMKDKIKLENVSVGALAFEREDRKENNKYIISLKYKGNLSKEVYNIMDDLKYFYGNSIENIINLNNDILDNTNTKNRFFTLTSIMNDNNNLFMGYEHNLNNFGFGIIGGISKLNPKSHSYGLYAKYNNDNFYLGSLLIRNKQDDKSLTYSDVNVATTVGYRFNFTPELYINSKITTILGNIGKSKIERDNIKATRESSNHIMGNLDVELGYKLGVSKLYTRFSLAKNLMGSDTVDFGIAKKELNYNSYDRTLSIGTDFDLGLHKFNAEISKKFTTNYKSDLRLNLGYSYKF